MKILAVECSEAPASCAVVEDGSVLCESFLSVPLTHSRTLMPMLEAMLRNADLTVADVDRLAVTVGPGSFTGLRIGVAAVKGLAMGASLPCVGVSTLEAAATAAAPLTGLICPVMDARCQQVYTALFESREGRLTRLWEDAALSVADLRERLSAALAERAGENLWLTGNGAAVWADALALPGARLAPPMLRSQRAAHAALLAQEATPVPAGELAPRYLRLPQAERELRARQNQAK